MNLRKIFSALDVGLVFVAVLSLIVASGFVEARTGDCYVDTGKSDWNWTIRVWIHAVWDDNGVIIPELSDAGYEAHGGTGVSCALIGSEQVINTYIVYQSVTAKFTPAIGSPWTIKVFAWVSSPNNPQQYDFGWAYV
ncbi:MAG: hypothetical protein FWB84_05770 [Candidatus Bathyarchaeota archaeon]|uniref:hypothetical protein n=1 Tax=Candidatus Bathycorpusculum sp. TaxID=2994959 RepID=UPI002820DF07|nr:hypothetical protein [Candidatus Termiticorpusculum sp.]MCL2291858.1 hypothetical protein [Candidatus Termiticorpusculum sp.]